MKSLVQPNNRKAAEAREKFQKTFRRFANVGKVKRGPGQSEIVVRTAAPRAKVDATEHLRKLYAILSRICQCPFAVTDSNFKTNLALDSRAQTNGAEEDLTIEMFILHQHPVGPQECNAWKEVCLKIFHERYVLPKPPSRKTFANVVRMMV